MKLFAFKTFFLLLLIIQMLPTWAKSPEGEIELLGNIVVYANFPSGDGEVANGDQIVRIGTKETAYLLSSEIYKLCHEVGLDKDKDCVSVTINRAKGGALIMPMLRSNFPAPQTKPKRHLSAKQYLSAAVNMKKLGMQEIAKELVGITIELDPNGDTGKTAKRFMQTELSLPKIPPDAAMANANGTSLCMSGDFDKAAKCFLKAISLCPQFDTAIVNLASVYCYQKDFDKATNLLDEEIAKNPSFTHAWLTKAGISMAKGQTKEGIRFAQKALDLNPDDKQAQAAMAELKKNTNKK